MDVSKAEEIWRHSYAHPGVWEQDFPPQSMTDLFIASTNAHPGAPLVDFYGRTYSYATMLAEARAFAAGLQAMGIGRGDRVGLFLPNVPIYIPACFGAMLAGAAGGAFGWASLPVELPLSTTIMLRSIADIARANGESINDIETQLACLMVFSMGGNSSGDDATESGYFATRIALTKSMADAASYLAQQGVINQGAPALIRFGNVAILVRLCARPASTYRYPRFPCAQRFSRQRDVAAHEPSAIALEVGFMVRWENLDGV